VKYETCSSVAHTDCPGVACVRAGIGFPAGLLETPRAVRNRGRQHPARGLWRGWLAVCPSRLRWRLVTRTTFGVLNNHRPAQQSGATNSSLDLIGASHGNVERSQQAVATYLVHVGDSRPDSSCGRLVSMGHLNLNRSPAKLATIGRGQPPVFGQMKQQGKRGAGEDAILRPILRSLDNQAESSDTSRPGRPLG
jgi:hypothetical protein